MPLHWTYSEFDPDQDLQQGDILRPDNEGLRALFREIHQHFCDPKYRGFMVTTQTCDLVLRSQGCSARYINLVAIRALNDVLFPLLDTVSAKLVEGIYYEDKKRDAKQLIERIFNQNESALGLFYLHQDADVALVEPCVALLRVGVDFRVDHYEVIRKARCGRLAPQFQAKLGWMLGNLYSRVATDDWYEKPNGRSFLRKMTETAIKGDGSSIAPKWVKREWVDAARQKGIEIESIPPDQLDDILEQHRPPTPVEQVIEQVTIAVKDVLPWVCSEEMRKIVNRLENNPLFRASFKAHSSDQ